MNGLAVPTTFTPKSWRLRSAAATATPGAPPSMKTRQPSRPASRRRGSMRSEPEIFSGTGVPRRRAPQTTNFPSATDRLAAWYAARKPS